MVFEMHSGVRHRGTINPAAEGKGDPGKGDALCPLTGTGHVGMVAPREV